MAKENYFNFTKLTMPITSRKEKDCRLIGLGYVDLSHEQSDTRKRSQRYFTLHFVISGTGHLEIAGKKYEIHKNDIFALPDEIPFRYYPDQDDPWEYLFFEFKGAFARDYFIDAGFSIDNLIQKCSRSQEVITFAQSFFHKYSAHNSLSYHEAVALFFLTLSSAKEAHLETTAVNEDTLIPNIKSFVKSRLLDPDFSVEYIASNFFISHSYLCKIFKQQTGKTLMSYIIGEKMKIAENLLQNSTYPITEIAFMSGFNNYSHFLSSFKELHGQTAGAYRKSFKEINNTASIKPN